MQGPIMRFRTNEGVELQMAPISIDELPIFVSEQAMHSHAASRYLGRGGAPCLEDEVEWFHHMRKDPDSIYWGVYALEDSGWVLLGGTSLGSISTCIFKQAVSGIMLFRQDYWGRGIASTCHRARTMYAFNELGLVSVRSAVYRPNVGSAKAIRKIGYVNVGIERNRGMTSGRRLHLDNYELINPYDWAWKAWWGSDRIPAAFQDARTRTLEALDWAESCVRFV